MKHEPPQPMRLEELRNYREFSSSITSKAVPTSTKQLMAICDSVEALVTHDLAILSKEVASLTDKMQTLLTTCKRKGDKMERLTQSIGVKRDERMVEHNLTKEGTYLSLAKFVNLWNSVEKHKSEWHYMKHRLGEWNSHGAVLNKIAVELVVLRKQCETYDKSLGSMSSLPFPLTNRFKRYIHRKYNPIKNQDGESIAFLWDFDLEPSMCVKKKIYVDKSSGGKYQVKERSEHHFVYKTKTHIYVYKPVNAQVAKIYLEKLAIDDSKVITPIINEIPIGRLLEEPSPDAEFMSQFTDVFEQIITRDHVIVRYDEDLLEGILDFLKLPTSSIILNNLSITPWHRHHHLTMAERLTNEDSNLTVETTTVAAVMPRRTHRVKFTTTTDNNQTGLVDVILSVVTEDYTKLCIQTRLLYFEPIIKQMPTATTVRGNERQIHRLNQKEAEGTVGKSGLNFPIDTLMPILLEYGNAPDGGEGKSGGFKLYPYTRDKRVLSFYLNTDRVRIVNNNSEVSATIKKRALLFSKCLDHREFEVKKTIQREDINLCRDCFGIIEDSAMPGHPVPDDCGLEEDDEEEEEENMVRRRRRINPHKKTNLPPPVVFADNIWFQEVDSFTKHRGISKNHIMASGCKHADGSRVTSKRNDKIVAQTVIGGKMYFIKEKTEANPGDPIEFIRRPPSGHDQNHLGVTESPPLHSEFNSGIHQAIGVGIEYRYYYVESVNKEQTFMLYKDPRNTPTGGVGGGGKFSNPSFVYHKWGGKIHRSHWVEDTPYDNGDCITMNAANTHKLSQFNPTTLDEVKYRYLQKYASLLKTCFQLFGVDPSHEGYGKLENLETTLASIDVKKVESLRNISLSAVLLDMDALLKKIMQIEGKEWLKTTGQHIDLPTHIAALESRKKEKSPSKIDCLYGGSRITWEPTTVFRRRPSNLPRTWPVSNGDSSPCQIKPVFMFEPYTSPQSKPHNK